MPALAVLGVSHRTTPVELRERLAIGDDRLANAVTALRKLGDEAYLLSTCNRTELYLVSEDRDRRAALVECLAETQDIPAYEFATHCYFMTDDEAARHLFRVASGLDSMVLGEDQVLGQVRAAFQVAQAAGTVQRTLGWLLPLAIETGRRARTETSIGRGSISPSSVAVTLAQRTLGDLRARSVLVIGAGEAGKAAARSLLQAGVERILVTNRSLERVEHLMAAVPAEAVPFDDLTNALCRADIAIGCTSAAEHVVSTDELRGVMARRPNGPLLCIDIAVPRDFDPTIAEIPGVHLYNIDDLEEASGETRLARAQEAAAAEVIVDEAVEEYRAWRRTQEVIPAVGAIYEGAEAIRRAEVERTLRRLGSVSAEDRVLIDLMTSSIVRRLLHGPVSVLKADADGANVAELARLARELFALPAEESRSPDGP